jgi:hypothetical protein
VNGKKDYLQKRHVLYSLRETCALFLKENPSVEVGLTKFGSLYPVNVLLSSNIPRNERLCQYHENIRLICDCLSKEIYQFPTYDGDFVNLFVCSCEREECMMGRCTACPHWIEEIAKGCDVLEKEVTWYEWERIDIAVPKCKSGKINVVKRMKVCKEGTVRDVLTSPHLRESFPLFWNMCL